MTKARIAMSRFVRFGLFSLLVIAMVGVMAATVIPTAKFFDQRDTEEETREELRQVQEESKDIRDRIRRFSKESSIEQLARGEYNLAYPGQQIFVLLP